MLDFDRDDHDVLVQDLVVPQVRQQCRWRQTPMGEHVHARSRHPGLWVSAYRVDESLDGEVCRAQPGRHETSPSLPRRHDDEPDGTDEEGEPAAARDLRDVRTQERQVEDEKQAGETVGDDRVPVPLPTHHDEEEHRGDDHDHRDADPVGARQVARRAEPEHQSDGRDHQQPVDRGHVDLAELSWRRVVDTLSGQIAELDRL